MAVSTQASTTVTQSSTEPTPEFVELPQYTMYSRTSAYRFDDVIVFGVWRPPLAPDSSDQIYVVTNVTENRLDLISDSFYGTPQLWWVIASVNNLLDSQIGIEIGAKLRIPQRARLSNLRIFKES